MYPILFEESLRSKLVWVIVEMLEPGIAVEWPGGVAPSMKPEGWKLESWMASPPRRRRCSVCATLFLRDLLYGPDVDFEDLRVRFTSGYERPLLSAILAAFARMHQTGNPEEDQPYLLLAGFAESFQASLNLPRSDLPERLRLALPKPDHCQTIPLLIYGYIGRSMTARACSNPECGLRQLNDNRAFQVCGGCKSMRYCSKACQKRHWKMNLEFWPKSMLSSAGPAPHKVTCPVICHVHATVPLTADSYAFERDFTTAVAIGAVTENDMLVLCSMMMADTVLPDVSKNTLLRMVCFQLHYDNPHS
ncbi:hypothetical protein EXIGLDRAFT_777325 [Exidia glandulosa HHB12029]|uniref:MYND-type domain-containing protein n=1 Tax=Exidia glandulosa HHB12029 TaxID=1314781 RepID=A0A165D363_EXIGL|nr:hypothetical protein EXIGLDRAFT_777325 [Exidia glandulosa HHB12029]